MTGLPRLAEFQAVWWSTALLARGHFGAAAAVPPLLYVLIHLVRSKRRASTLALAAMAGALGAAADHVLVRVGAIAFLPELDVGPSPPFMVGLWAAFACTFETSLAGLAARPLWGAALGALGGVLSYRGAAALGVLSLGADEVRTAMLLAVTWAVAMPIIGGLARAVASDIVNRRVRTISVLLALTTASLLLWPLLLAASIAVDVVRRLWLGRPFMSLRLLAFGMAYLAAELLGVAALTLVGLGPPHEVLRRTYRVQERWTAALFAAVTFIFRLRFHVEDDARARPGPVVVLVRHTSIIDTLVPSVLLTQRHGLKLRFILKRELLADPCMDIAGTRLPNHFVARGGHDTEGDLAAIRALAAGMGSLSDEGVLIYPEGTRFSATKHARAWADVATRNPHLACDAAEMAHVLPPKPAGVGALLDGAPDADVVVLGHTGLEGFGRIGDIWSGAQLGRTVRVKVWRVPRAEIPQATHERTRWLYAQWRTLNAWVEEARRTGRGS